jgi:hypothetical protein
MFRYCEGGTFVPGRYRERPSMTLHSQFFCLNPYRLIKYFFHRVFQKAILWLSATRFTKAYESPDFRKMNLPLPAQQVAHGVS